MKTIGTRYANRSGSVDVAAAGRSHFARQVDEAAHEPLTRILGMASLLAETPLSDKQRQYLDAIRAASEQALALVHDLVELTRLEEGDLSLDLAPTDLGAETMTVCEILGVTAGAQGGEVIVQTPATDAPWVLTDARRIRQILFALIGEAVRCSKSGQVIVKIEEEAAPSAPSCCRIAITVSDAHGTRGAGPGGLSFDISRRLGVLLGGAIGIDRRPDGGHDVRAVFDFERSDVAPRNASHASGSADQEAQPPLKVLIAEDNRANQLILLELMSLWGNQAVPVGGGLEALAAVERESFDVILMDIQMPRLDGVSAMQRIRALGGRFEALPIIAVTANAFGGERERLISLGFSDFVAKPINFEVLKECLDRWNGAWVLDETDNHDTDNIGLIVIDEDGYETLPRIDPQRIDAMLLSADVGRIETLVRESWRAIETGVAQLGAAIDTECCGSISVAACELAGAASHLGAVQLRTLAQAIECSADDQDEVRSLFKRVRDIVAPTRQELAVRIAVAA